MKNKKYTRKMHENYLNNFYSDNYTSNDIIDKLIYLAKYKNDIKCENLILKHYNNRTLGKLLRKQDITSFNVSYNEKCEEK